MSYDCGHLQGCSLAVSAHFQHQRAHEGGGADDDGRGDGNVLVRVGHVNLCTSNNAINHGADDTTKQPRAHACAVNSSVVNSTRTVAVKTMETVLRCLLGAMAVLCIASRVHQRCRPVAAPLVALALQSSLHVFDFSSRHSNTRRSGPAWRRRPCRPATVSVPVLVMGKVEVTTAVADLERMINAVPRTIAAALNRKAYY